MEVLGSRTESKGKCTIFPKIVNCALTPCNANGKQEVLIPGTFKPKK